MKITIETLIAVAGTSARPETERNMAAVVAGLDLLGPHLGLDKPHRLAHYIAQIAHESGRFRYDREIWDGKGAQAGYDTRTDLGNTPALDGDGKLFRGRTGIQVTGRANYASFRDRCRAQNLEAPDFVLSPDAILTDPWEGLAPLWFWSSRGLNRFADENNIEMITRRINGGMNGFDDRVQLYVRAALVLLGYQRRNGVVREFQTSQGLVADDIAGPKTRDALHQALVAMDAPAAIAPITPIAASLPLPSPVQIATAIVTPSSAEPPDWTAGVSKAIGAAKGAVKGGLAGVGGPTVVASLMGKLGLLPNLTPEEMVIGFGIVAMIAGSLVAGIMAYRSAYKAPANKQPGTLAPAATYGDGRTV